MTRQKNSALTNKITRHIPPPFDNESDVEYIWFQVYCMHGINRTLQSVATLLQQQEPEKSNSKTPGFYNKIKAASTAFDWVNRAQQYDINRWAATVTDLAENYTQTDIEWQAKCEDTRRVIGETIRAALDIQETNNLILEVIRENAREYKDNIPAMFKLKKALKEMSSTTIDVLEILSKAWQIREHTQTIQMAESWQQQALEALRKE